MVPPPSQGSQINTTIPQYYRFIYKGTEYDATEYITKHPGGQQFIKNMKFQRDDFTEYFKALHSVEAEKILTSFPIVKKLPMSETSKEYFALLEKVQHLYKPNWVYQIGFVIFVAALLFIGCFTQHWWLGAICFGLSQVVDGWMSHSCAHSRDKQVQWLGKRCGSLIGGYSESWWSPKHNMHHMFTNSELFDEDIKHSYKIYLYPFLYLKWRFDSLEQAIKTKNYLDITLILINYCFIFYNQKIWIFILGQLLGGFYSANVLIGNHERQVRFKGKIQMPFIQHQIVTCRNYRQNSFIWLVLMGGMQYQTQHHLFPQIPFYRIPEAEGIIRDFLKQKDTKIIYGPVL